MGAIVVVDNQIISTGYNGTPSALKNCCDFGCARCNENISQGKHLDKCRCIHAEENSLLFCGITRAKGGTVYVTLFPCLWCAKIIVQAVNPKKKYHWLSYNTLENSTSGL